MTKPAPAKPPSRLLPIAAILIILIGFGIRFFSRDDAPPAPTPIDPTETQTAAANDAPVEVEAPTQRRAPSLPFNPRATELRRVEEIEAQPEAENPYGGEWSVLQVDKNDWDEIGRATLTPEGPNGIRLAGDFRHSENLSLLRMSGDVVEADYVWADEVSGRFTGGFNAEKTELTLSGTLHHPSEREPEYSKDTAFRFVKVPEDQLAREARLAEYQRHAQDLLRTIQEFAKENNGIPPRFLEDLVPDYIDDPSILESTAEHEIAYDPNGTLGPPEFPDWQDLHVDLMPPAELIAHEQELARLWGTDLFAPRPVLTVRYPNDGYVVYADGLRRTDYDDLHAEGANDVDLAALVKLCQNNLNQFGLVGKMLENEHPEQRWPAGPHHVFPEYLANPRIMTCPSVERGTISYEYIFPAANEAELREMYREVSGLGAEEIPRYPGSQIPMMYESHLCATGDGSNVLFLSGHVEFLTPGEFAERIEPFLRVRIH